jgi:hypothetical protein
LGACQIHIHEGVPLRVLRADAGYQLVVHSDTRNCEYLSRSAASFFAINLPLQVSAHDQEVDKLAGGLLGKL